ncbi:MAG: PAS domain S-box protein [Desulfatibacillaceae bacterium]|nr:PAS domain S-box protein [Desulfatibacillaceae bacterium]
MDEQSAPDGFFKNQALYRLIFENSRDAIGLAKNGLHHKVNKAHLKLLGVESEAELLGRPTVDFIAPEELDRIRSIVQRRAKGKSAPDSYITKGLKNDGSRFIMEVNANSYTEGDDSYTVVILRDITDRYITEQVVRLLRSIDEHLSEAKSLEDSLSYILARCIELEHIDCGGIYLVDEAKERIVLAAHAGISETFVEHAGRYSKETPNYRIVLKGEFVYGQFDMQRRLDENHPMKKEGLKGIAILPITYQGKVIAAVNLASKIYEEIPQALHSGLESVALQIGRAIARMRTEEALKESEHKYRTLVENSPDAICIVQDGKICFCNQTAIQKSGYLPDELISKTVTSLIEPDERPDAASRIETRLQGDDVGSRNYSLICKNGSRMAVQVMGAPINWKGRSALLFQVRDITREQELERQLQHSQRMESLGTLASGIAHDFNNVLMALQGNVSLMLLGKDDSHPDYRRLFAMQSAISNATGMTRQLLGFARGGQVKKSPADLMRIVEKVIRIFAPTRKDITFEFSPQTAAPVDVDITQMEQVLANLIINAFQAMPQGGKISISIFIRDISEKCPQSAKLAPGSYVQLSLTDTGCGIPPESTKHIFDPFYSTKDKSTASGLGLTSAYWIVSRHSGMIFVESVKGQGSTFHICLPCSKGQVVEKPENDARIITGSGTILIVDDEASVLETLGNMCQHLGYSVMMAPSARQGLKIYEENLNRIDLVILDFLMPETNGKQLFKAMRKINGNARILLCSGYSMDEQIQDILSSINGIINKPIDITALGRAIKKALG